MCRVSVPPLPVQTQWSHQWETRKKNQVIGDTHRFRGVGGADTQRIDRRTTHRHDCDQLSFIDHENAYFPDDAVREPVGFPGEDIGHYETRETMLLTATHTCIRHPPAPTRRESGSPI